MILKIFLIFFFCNDFIKLLIYVYYSTTNLALDLFLKIFNMYIYDLDLHNLALDIT